MEELNVQAFLAGGIFRCGQSAAIKEMDLINVGNADHCKRCIKDDSGARLLQCFAAGCLGRGFAVLHEAGWQCPETEPGLDSSPAKQNLIFMLDDAADN